MQVEKPATDAKPFWVKVTPGTELWFQAHQVAAYTQTTPSKAVRIMCRVAFRSFLRGMVSSKEENKNAD